MTVETVNYVMKTLQGDMVTPISAFLSIKGRNKVLFESAAKHEESGRYSFIAFDPIAELIGDNQHYLFKKNGEEEKVEGTVFQKLRELLPVSKEPFPFSFFGGAIGYISYDTAFYNEKIGDVLPDELNMPDVHLLFYDRFIVIDHLLQKVAIVAIDLFLKAKRKKS